MHKSCRVARPMFCSAHGAEATVIAATVAHCAGLLVGAGCRLFVDAARDCVESIVSGVDGAGVHDSGDVAVWRNDVGVFVDDGLGAIVEEG